MKRAGPQATLCAAGMAAILLLWSQPVLGQSDPPAPAGSSRGENFSAKPAPQLFATDCTGAGCHKGPQGLGKNYGQFGLTTFLREHYTNSRQSAAALADYLLRTQGAAEARNPRGTPGTQSSRAAARPDEVTPGSPSPSPPTTRRAAEPNDAKPAAGGRNQRGRHTTAATPTVAPTATTPTAATPTAATPTPEPPPPPAPPAPPTPKQYDIFD